MHFLVSQGRSYIYLFIYLFIYIYLYILILFLPLVAWLEEEVLSARASGAKGGGLQECTGGLNDRDYNTQERAGLLETYNTQERAGLLEIYNTQERAG